MLNEQVENVMAIAFELARIREEHGAQSGMYLSEVRALRAEAERLAAQAARDDAALYQTIGERDNYHKWADKLADGIATHLGIDIGEHTAGAGANNPWANALEAIQAVAQSAPLAQQAREYPPLPKLPTMTVLSELQSGTQEMVRLDVAHEAMRAYVDADRAAAHVEPPSMPSSEWLAEAERIAGEFTVAVANGESAAAALAYSNLRAHLSKRVTADAVRMLTEDEIFQALLAELQQPGGVKRTPNQIVQHAFCRVNRGRFIPDGEVRNAV